MDAEIGLEEAEELDNDAARGEEDISASCSARRSRCWAWAKFEIEMEEDIAGLRCIGNFALRREHGVLQATFSNRINNQLIFKEWLELGPNSCVGFH